MTAVAATSAARRSSKGDARHRGFIEKARKSISSSIVAPHKDQHCPAALALTGFGQVSYCKNHANIYVLIYKSSALQRRRRGEID